MKAVPKLKFLTCGKPRTPEKLDFVSDYRILLKKGFRGFLRMNKKFAELRKEKGLLHAFVKEYISMRSDLGLSRISQERFCADLKQRSKDFPSHQNLASRKMLSDKCCQALADYFDEKASLNEVPKSRIESILESVVKSSNTKHVPSSNPKKQGLDAYAIAQALGGWISPQDLDGKFVDKCANEWGNFLLMRMPLPGQIVSSEMEIRHDPASSLFPIFETRKYLSGKQDGEATIGSIFKSSTGVYAIGRLVQDETLRVSSLSYRVRKTRTDMFGVRTGVLKENRRFYSHLIYLYQLSDEKREKVLVLREINDPKEKFAAVSEILHEHIDSIVSALTPDKVPEENGSPIFQYGFQPIIP